MVRHTGRGEEELEVVRPLDCDYCQKKTLFRCGAWLHCTVCKRCFTCLTLRSAKCKACVIYEGETKKMGY